MLNYYYYYAGVDLFLYTLHTDLTALATDIFASKNDP